MKNNINKILLTALFFVTLVGLVACGNSNETTNNNNNNQQTQPGTPSEPAATRPDGWLVDEEITLSLMSRNMGHAEWRDMPFWHYLANKTGVNFDFNTPPYGDDFTTALNLALASGNVSDVLVGTGLTPAQQIEFGEGGVLIPLQDLIANYAPNIEAFLNENPIVRAAITAPDGNIYALPQINRSREASWIAGPLWYNGAHLEALGFDAPAGEVPRTLAEFDQTMERMRDELGIIPISDGWQMNWFRNWFIGTFGIANNAVEISNGVARHNATTDNYRAYLEHMNMYFTEGILHPEIFTLTIDPNLAQVADGNIGLFQGWYPMFPLGVSDEEGPNNPMFHPLTSEWSPTPIIPMHHGISPGQFAITHTNSNPVATIQFFDFFYSYEGSHFAQMGPQGYFWDTATNAAGEEVIIFGSHVDLDDADARGRLVPFFGFPAPHVLYDLPHMFRPDAIDEEVDLSFDTFIRRETANILRYGVVALPPSMMTVDEAAAIAEVNTSLTSFILQMEAEFIAGVRPLNDDTWAEFQAQLETIGVNRVVEIHQAIVDRIN